MQKILITSKNGYFKYSGKLRAKFEVNGKRVQGNFEIGGPNLRSTCLVCRLSKTPFEFKSEFQRRYSGLEKVRVGRDVFYIKVVRVGCTEDYFGTSTDQGDLDGMFSDVGARNRGKIVYAFLQMDSLRLPTFLTSTEAFRMKYFRTWRELKATPVAKIDLDTFQPQKPILIEIPMSKFGLKKIDKNALSNPYVQFMRRFNSTLGTTGDKYTDETNVQLAKTKSKFCYIYLDPSGGVAADKSFGGFFLEDEGVAK